VFLDYLFVNTRPCRVEETVLSFYIVVMFSFLAISMGLKLVVVDLHLSEQELHLVCIIVTLNVVKLHSDLNWRRCCV
jgi:hypothetical protein